MVVLKHAHDNKNKSHAGIGLLKKKGFEKNSSLYLVCFLVSPSHPPSNICALTHIPSFKTNTQHTRRRTHTGKNFILLLLEEPVIPMYNRTRLENKHKAFDWIKSRNKVKIDEHSL